MNKLILLIILVIFLTACATPASEKLLTVSAPISPATVLAISSKAVDVYLTGTSAALAIFDNGWHYGLPSVLPAGLNLLTIGEQYEYILRQLTYCQPCNIDTSGMTLDIGQVHIMALDSKIQRMETSQIMSDYKLLSVMEHAIDVQAEVAKHGMDSIVKVAVSGDAAQTATAVTGMGGMTIIAISPFVVAILAYIIIIKKNKEIK